ncbi:MAG TPA: hypothetical protein VHU22_17400 [Xanthobacteraceae bacterium]|jgi:hypothetical protein|nr:hypothetical protein [Xanthobacteraceae bacterium]
MSKRLALWLKRTSDEVIARRYIIEGEVLGQKMVEASDVILDLLDKNSYRRKGLVEFLTGMICGVPLGCALILLLERFAR